MGIKITKFAVLEDSCLVCMARVLGAAGAAVTQATVSSITCKVFDKDTSTTTADYTATLDKTVVISDTLLVTAPWTVDQTGRNFTHTVPATAFPRATDDCWIEYTFVMTNADQIKMVFDGEVQETLGD